MSQELDNAFAKLSQTGLTHTEGDNTFATRPKNVVTVASEHFLYSIVTKVTVGQQQMFGELLNAKRLKWCYGLTRRVLKNDDNKPVLYSQAIRGGNTLFHLEVNKKDFCLASNVKAPGMYRCDITILGQKLFSVICDEKINTKLFAEGRSRTRMYKVLAPDGQQCMTVDLAADNKQQMSITTKDVNGKTLGRAYDTKQSKVLTITVPQDMDPETKLALFIASLTVYEHDALVRLQAFSKRTIIGAPANLILKGDTATGVKATKNSVTNKDKVLNSVEGNHRLAVTAVNASNMNFGSDKRNYNSAIEKATQNAQQQIATGATQQKTIGTKQ